MRLNFASFDESETCIGKRSKKSIGVPRLNFAGFRRRYNSALKQCGTKGFAFVRFGALCCAGAPPPVRRASLQAARRTCLEAQPAARGRRRRCAARCAAPEGQGEAAQACYGGAGKQRAGAPNRRNRDKVLVRYAGAERKAERRTPFPRPCGRSRLVRCAGAERKAAGGVPKRMDRRMHRKLARGTQTPVRASRRGDDAGGRRGRAGGRRRQKDSSCRNNRRPVYHQAAGCAQNDRPTAIHKTNENRVDAER